MHRNCDTLLRERPSLLLLIAQSSSYLSRIAICAYPTCIRRPPPPLGRSSSNVWYGKTRMVWLYPTVKNRCVYSFWQNLWTWRTDGRMDRASCGNDGGYEAMNVKKFDVQPFWHRSRLTSVTDGRTDKITAVDDIGLQRLHCVVWSNTGWNKLCFVLVRLGHVRRCRRGLTTDSFIRREVTCSYNCWPVWVGRVESQWVGLLKPRFPPLPTYQGPAIDRPRVGIPFVPVTAVPLCVGRK